MKRFILLLLILSAQVFAQFNPAVFEDEIKRKGYSVDLNGTDEFASVTPNLRLTGKYALRDDFSVDGMTGVTNRGWVVSSGSYTVNNLVDNPLSANDYALVCQTAGVISIPCNQAYGKWSFDLYKGADANDSRIHFISDIAALAATNGYRFLYNNAEDIYLTKFVNGGATHIMRSAVSYIQNTTWYHIDIYRNTNGSFSVYLNNVLVSTTGGSGTNPVTDNTYTSSNYFVLDLDANDRISNIQCEYGEGSLDLNSFERFKFSFDRDMEKANNWTATGNHSIADSSTVDKHGGSYSNAITSSGAGDATTNYVSLPSNYFTTLVNGEKYTLEYWARGTGVLGSALYTSNFTSDANGWTGTRTNINGNVDNIYGRDDVLSMQATTDNNTHYLYLGTAPATATYKIQFDYYLRNNTNVKGLTFRQGLGAATDISCPVCTTVGSWTSVSFTTASIVSGTSLSIRLLNSALNVSTTYSGSVGDDSVYVKNIVITPIALPSLTLNIGSQSKTFTNISCVPNTWTKCVFNFQATSNEVGQMIKLYANQADAVYLDDFSLTRFYPSTISGWFKTSTSGVDQILISKATSATGLGIRRIYLTSGNVFAFSLVDVSTYTANTVTTFTDNLWHYFTVVLDVPSCSLYVDNVSTGMDLSVGNTNNTQSYTIGKYSYAATGYYTGLIGETQFLKDYAKTQAEHLAEWKNGMKRYNQEQIRIKWKGTTDAEMLRDWSGVGNNLTGTNVSTADQQKATYKAK